MVFENIYTKHFKSVDYNDGLPIADPTPTAQSSSQPQSQSSSKGNARYPQVFTTTSANPTSGPNKAKHDWGPILYPKFTSQVPRPSPSATSKTKHTLPSQAEIREAIAKLSDAMTYISDRYGLIGGSAVVSYADHYGLPQRLTADINLIIQPDLRNAFTAEGVAQMLCSVEFSTDFAVKRVSGVDIPQARVMRGGKELLLDVEVLDHYVRAERRADYDLSLSKNEPIILAIETYSSGKPNVQAYEHDVFLLNAPWILRQKILTWNEIEGLQRARDKMDIETLCDVLNAENKTLKMNSERDTKKLKEFLKEFDNDPMVLGSVIDCPQVFGPWYNLKWVRRTFAGLLLIVAPLAFDHFTSHN
jgi:hypothetical protein